MKKFAAILVFAALLLSLSATVFAARQITEEEKAMLADMKGKEVLGRKISDSDIASIENFLMSSDRPLTQTDIDNILANIDEVLNIILMSGATSLKDLPKDVMDKIMKITDSAASSAGLSVSLSSAPDIASSVTITSKKENRPVIIPAEKVVKATGGPYINSPQPNRFSALTLTFLAAFFGLSVVMRRKSIKSVDV